MSGWLEQPGYGAPGQVGKNGHNPWESGLKERQEKERKEKEEKEARERQEKLAAEQAERERLASIEAARPKPTGPPKAEFMSLVNQTQDKDAKVGMLKSRVRAVLRLPLTPWLHAARCTRTHASARAPSVLPR